MASVDSFQRADGGPDALQTTDPLDIPPAFDPLARLVSRLLKAPTALICLIAEDRQLLIGAHGLPETWESLRQGPLHSICKHAVAGKSHLVVSDARTDPLVRNHLAFRDLEAIACLGVPILGLDGDLLGVILAMDSTPRGWSEDDIATMAALSQAVTSQIGAHLYRRERARYEEAQKAGEARTAEILESIDDAFFAIDRHWRLLYVNRHAERLWGRRREEILGRTIFEIFPVFGESETHRACERAMAQGRPARIETVSRVLGVPVEVNIFPSPSGLSVYFRDISARKRMEEALRERDDILSLAERSAGIGIWDVDLATGMVRGTPQFFRLFGLEPADNLVSIEAMRAVRHPDDRNQVIQGFEAAVESGTDYYEMEYRILRPDGEVRWIFGRGRVVRDAHGQPVRYSGVDIDITDRKQMEEHRQLLLAELNHRVRNTIATIQSIARQSLADGRPLEEAREAFLSRLEALAHTHILLTESGWRGAKLSALVEDELRPYGNRATVAGDDLVLAPKAALIIGLILHELATNAAKHGAFTAPAGHIGIGWSVEDEAVFRLVWQERCPGIAGPPVRRGFGSRLLEQAVTYELQGEAVLEFASEGLRYEFTAPLQELLRQS